MMGAKLSQPERDLYIAVDEVLHYIWDPIGVAGVPQARDEYHGYLPQVFSLVRNGENEQVIADYLALITTENMGLSMNLQHDLEVARILIDWKESIDEKCV
jgi:hypothetical protein